MQRSPAVTRRWTTAVMLLLAALVGFVVPCLCAAEAPGGHGDAHACCASRPGLRALDASCCADETASDSPAWTLAGIVHVAGPASFVPLVDRPLDTGAAPLPPLRPLSSSPPLRI